MAWSARWVVPAGSSSPPRSCREVTEVSTAVFLLKTKEGAGYTPPPATGTFADVPQADIFAPWIEELYVRQITGGCQASPLLYCPDNPNTGGQMAVLFTKAFGLE